jgi:hypothetical protein
MFRRKYLETISATMGGLAVAGCSGGEDEDSPTGGESETADDSSAVANQCEPPLNDEDTDLVRVDGEANEEGNIESVEVNVRNTADFPISATINAKFYAYERTAAPFEVVKRDLVLEPQESREIQVTRAEQRYARAWDATVWEVRCP